MSEKGEISLTREQIARLWEKPEKDLAPEDFDPEAITAKITIEKMFAKHKKTEKGLTPIGKSLQEEMEEAGLGGDSFEVASETEQDIKKGLDDAIETENIFSSEIPLNKSGLPPCQRAKLESERTIQTKDARLNRE